jgi:hypothetical protein
MIMEKKSLRGVDKAKPKQAAAKPIDPDGKSDMPPKLVLAKKLAMAKGATAKLTAAKLVTTRRLGG